MARPPFPVKPKTRTGVPLSTFLLLLLMVLMGIAIGGSAVLVGAPTLFNVAVTQAYFQTQAAQLENQAQALAATRVELDTLRGAISNDATAQSINLLATDSALQNDAALLAQTATQSRNFALATATANAANTTRQLTLVAQDYRATQSQLNQNATQVELNYQATLSALSVEPQSNNVAPGLQALAAVVAAPTATVVVVPATPRPTFLPFDSSATPRPGELPFFEQFSNGIASERWLSSGSTDWSQSQESIVSQSEQAWVMSRRAAVTDARIVWKPALQSPATYDVVLIGQNGENWFIRLSVEALNVVRTSVYRFDGGLPIQGVGELLIANSGTAALKGSNDLTITLGQTLTVTLNDTLLLTMTERTLPDAPTVGVQFPIGASLSAITLN